MSLLTMGLGAGLSLLSSFGASQSAKKQAKMQQANDEFARRWNEDKINANNLAKEELGRELLATPQITDQRNWSHVDVDQMMLDADKAGFNPVTWLQGGALAAYTQSGTYTSQTQPVAAFSLMTPDAHLISASQAIKQPNALEAVGDAGMVALNMYRQDAARDDSQAFQRDLLNLQLDAIQKGRASGSSFSIPRMTSSGGGIAGSMFPTGSSFFKPEVGKSTFTDPQPGGQNIDPGIADAANSENRYGDNGPLGWWDSWEVSDRDMYVRMFGKTREQFWQDLGAWNPMNPAPNYGQRHPGYDQPFLGVPH